MYSGKCSNRSYLERANVIYQNFICTVAPLLVDDVLLPPDIRNTLRDNQNPETADEVTCQEAKDDVEEISPEDDNRDKG